MSYTKFLSRYRGCKINNPHYIADEKKFPQHKIFACMDMAAAKGLLSTKNKKRGDVAFVSALSNGNTLSIFIEEKGKTVHFSEVSAQLTSTIAQMEQQGIFDKRGKEKISLVVYSKKSPRGGVPRKMRQGIAVSINGKRQKIRILSKIIRVKNQSPLWNDACGAAQTF